jgi:uncharacterized protein YjbI with pentapeptide repeats
MGGKIHLPLISPPVFTVRRDMANEKHLKILKQGVEFWNKWRNDNPKIEPDLYGASLYGANLRRSNLCDANLRRALLSDANLREAQLTHAYLEGANLSSSSLWDVNLVESYLSGANLNKAHLVGANLWGASLQNVDLSNSNLHSAILRNVDLSNANLTGADLNKVDLSGAFLSGTIINSTNLREANLDRARIGKTVFVDVDLREVLRLETVHHLRSSEISLSTIYRSEGDIPEEFLRGCGVPDEFITHIPSLVLAIQPIQFYSCFISYSSKDEEFARRLHERMRAAGLHVWFAPEDIKGGEKLDEQIDRAIQVHDRLLLVLSESSLRSRWVEREIRRARNVELREERRKLFPIRLARYEALQEWVCLNSTTGEDVAEEVRSYFIPDFSNWKNHDDFEKAFARLLSDLKASTQ